jgi:hypothetical protein
MDKNPAHQTGEDKSQIKRRQQIDATMAEKDLPRGFEKETHARK